MFVYNMAKPMFDSMGNFDVLKPKVFNPDTGRYIDTRNAKYAEGRKAKKILPSSGYHNVQTHKELFTKAIQKPNKTFQKKFKYTYHFKTRYAFQGQLSQEDEDLQIKIQLIFKDGFPFTLT